MLAVAGAKRPAFFPNVTTLAELGFKGAELDIWFGMWAPNGTPADVTARMTNEIAKALIKDSKINVDRSGQVPNFRYQIGL